MRFEIYGIRVSDRKRVKSVIEASTLRDAIRDVTLLGVLVDAAHSAPANTVVVSSKENLAEAADGAPTLGMGYENVKTNTDQDVPNDTTPSHATILRQAIARKATTSISEPSEVPVSGIAQNESPGLYLKVLAGVVGGLLIISLLATLTAKVQKYNSRDQSEGRSPNYQAAGAQNSSLFQDSPKDLTLPTSAPQSQAEDSGHRSADAPAGTKDNDAAEDTPNVLTTPAVPSPSSEDIRVNERSSLTPPPAAQEKPNHSPVKTLKPVTDASLKLAKAAIDGYETSLVKPSISVEQQSLLLTLELLDDIKNGWDWRSLAVHLSLKILKKDNALDSLIVKVQSPNRKTIETQTVLRELAAPFMDKIGDHFEGRRPQDWWSQIHK